ncbi:MAG: hypothetical protein WC219_05070 [Acholeplasmataceae bacterium]|jgi:hypothetical protein|nr:hypothetical protein [Bacteroidales bacterium]
MSNLIKNTPQDLEIKYKASTYEFIEKILNQETKDVPMVLFMLSLLGITNDKKIPLESESKNEGTHNFSIRTMYNRNESDFDAYIGLISILDNLELPPEQVINSIAFERTGVNGTTFLKMKNVKSFFEYMLGGIDVFNNKFFIYDKSNVGLVDAIHDYLISDYNKLDELIRSMVLEEMLENE